MSHLRASARSTILAICLLLYACHANATVPANDLSEPLSLAGQWQFQIGDDVSWAAPGFDDSGWQATAVPAHAPDGQAGYSGMLWYRLSLQLDLASPSVQDNLEALAVTLGSVMSSYEFYAGGTPVGRVGALPPNPVGIYDQQRTWPVPASAVDADGKLVLALRVWRNPEIGEQWETGPFLGEFLLGNVGDLRERLLFTTLWPEAFLALLYLVLGFYHLLIARRNPSLREFFWFGSFCVVLATYTFEASQAKFLVDVPFLWHKKIEVTALFLCPIALGMTLLTVTRTSANWLISTLNAVFLLYFLAALLLPLDRILLILLRSFQYLGAFWTASMALIMARRAYQGSRSARGIVVLLLLFTAAIFNDAILKIALVGSGNVLYLVMALLLLGIALMMAERYTDILKTLESAVARRTAELVDTNKELEAAVETKGQFLANMSHEMRTPMNAILGLSRLGMQSQGSDKQQDYFSKVESSGEEMLHIIESILDFSLLSGGELEVCSEPFDPAAMMKDTQRLWQERMEEAGLTLRVETDTNTPAALIGDVRCLKQALGNMLSNALKFTPQGEVGVTLSVQEQNESNARIRFAVSDTGIGIAKNQQQALFEAFSQADNSSTREYGGTGIGLSIAQGLVTLMGGNIAVESQPGQGSTFSFELTLPVAEAIPATQATPDELDLAPIRGARVLLVDDADLNLQVAGELLRRAQLYVDVAHDGSEALEKVLKNSYDCVLMDVQMPVMDGYTATKAIRSHTEFSALPVLAMTANALSQDRALGKEAGMNAYIPKPVDPDELYSALLHWIPPGEREYAEEVTEELEDDGAVLAMPDSLPGIDIADGLNRVGGNEKLYRNLLKDLAKDYADVAQRIQALLSAEDREVASALAHKVRGIANNLGAYDLGLSAEALETHLKTNEPISADVIAELQSTVNVIVESFSTLAPTTSSIKAASSISPEQRQSLIDQLIQAINENNPDAQEFAEQLLASTAEGASEHETLVAVIEALEMYDFATAGDALAGLEWVLN